MRVATEQEKAAEKAEQERLMEQIRERDKKLAEDADAANSDGA